MPSNIIANLFDKIIVNHNEIDINSLVNNNGKYHIPGEIKNAVVEFILKDKTTIPSNLFNNNKQIKKVKIPETITTIESYAFSGNYNMSYVFIPNTVSYIGTYAFNNTNITDDLIDKIQTINQEEIIIVYSDEEAFTYNSYLPGAISYGDVKIPAQDGVDEVLYTYDEINSYNSNLVGAIHGGDPKNKQEEPEQPEEPTNNYKYYLNETDQEEFNIDDLNLSTSEKITEFTLHPCSDDVVSVWIYPESWGYPSRIVDANNNECTAMWDNADDWMTVPEGYIGKYIANITSTCIFYVTWD